MKLLSPSLSVVLLLQTAAPLASFLLESHLPPQSFSNSVVPSMYIYIYLYTYIYIDRVEGGKNIWEIVISIEPIKRVPAARRTILRVDRRLPQIYSTDKFVGSLFNRPGLAQARSPID